MFFINFKTYEQGTGTNALGLIRSLEEVASEKEIKIIPVVQPSDVKEAVFTSKLEIWVQHIDPSEFGAHTGSVIAEAVVEDGAVGTFLNHSEHKFENYEDLSRAVERAKNVGLKTLVFAADLNELRRVLTLNPTFLAYEPPELVGSKTTSVAREKPEIIKEAVDLARDNGLPLIVGAGIKSNEDIVVSTELGASGFAIASDIVTAEDPQKAMRELIDGSEDVK
jgi:triosephosphate isomerase (TIM)